jgi:transposase
MRMFEVTKQAYTAEFKAAAVQRVKDGQRAGAAARELGVSEQMLRNWVKAEQAGKLNGPGAKAVTPEHRGSKYASHEFQRYRTHREAAADLFEYIDVFYNRSRHHSSLGFMSRAQFIQHWLAAQQAKDAAA